MQPDLEIINRWRGSAPFWEKHRDVIRQMFAPITKLLSRTDRLGVRTRFWILLRGPENLL
jgi:hypothetical protein